MRARALVFLAAAAAPYGMAVPMTSIAQSIASLSSVRVETIAEGVSVPSAMVFLPDGRALVASRSRAELYSLNVLSRELQRLHVPVSVLTGEDAGIHDVILHQEYAANRWIYVSYSEGTAERSTTAVDRMRLVGNGFADVHRVFTADAHSEDRFHYGGRLALIDGYLYVTLGDRHHQDRAQDLAHHFGTIVRLFDDGRVPPDNPFVERPGARPEIWSYGHRHPQGLVRHPETGEIWFHEHGPLGGDELNVLRRGANYGWPVVSSGWQYGGGPIGKGIVSEKGMEDPVWVWSKTIAPSGALFYTSDRVPAWRGSLFVGALAGRHVNRLVIDGERVVLEERLLLGHSGRVRTVQQGPDGAIYIGDDDGRILRVVPNRAR